MKKKNKKEQKLKKIVKLIEVAPYDQDCIVVVNGDFMDAYNKMKKFDSENARANIKHVDENIDTYKNYKKTPGVIFIDLPYGFVMLIQQSKSWIETVGTVVHEAVHLSHYVARNVGLELTKESEEAYTYMTEKIVKDILHIIWKNK